ncbi:unnamed protein product, partial [Sphagnum balticum]
ERHHGVLFNETPPPPKQKMKWEDWELPYYATAIMAVLLLAVGLSAKRDTRIETWARKGGNIGNPSLGSMQDVTERLCSTHKVESLSLVGGLDGHIHQDKVPVETQPSATV